MPTLIRLLVILLVLGGIGLGAMLAVIAVVEPREKDVTIRIPTRDLVPQSGHDPLVRREIDTTRVAPASQQAVQPATAPAATPEAPAPAATDESGVQTLSPGVE